MFFLSVFPTNSDIWGYTTCSDTCKCWGHMYLLGWSKNSGALEELKKTSMQLSKVQGIGKEMLISLWTPIIMINLCWSLVSHYIPDCIHMQGCSKLLNLSRKGVMVGPADSLTSRIKATVSRRARAGGSRPPMTAMEAAWQWNTSKAVGEIVLFGHYWSILHDFFDNWWLYL